MRKIKNLMRCHNVLWIGSALLILEAACSKFQKARNRLEGTWRYTRFELWQIDSVGNTTLLVDSTENLGLFRVSLSQDSKDAFEYSSDVFNAPAGTFKLSREGLRLYFQPSGFVYYIKEIKSDRMILIRHTETLPSPSGTNHAQERVFHFSKSL